MRLIDAQTYRGKRIRVYVTNTENDELPGGHRLGVRIDDEVVEETPWLSGITEASQAMTWGRDAVDRLLGPDGHDPIMPASPI